MYDILSKNNRIYNYFIYCSLNVQNYSLAKINACLYKRVLQMNGTSAGKHVL